MGKTQFCRICRTENNLKYTAKELRQLNKKQLLLAHATQQGQANSRASQKLLLTAPTLGNICQICDERIQIFHRLDDGGHDSSSDVEIEVIPNTNEKLPMSLVDSLSNGDFLQRAERPETPVIVDDDDMLFNIFMQKFDQKTQLQRHPMDSSLARQQTEGQLANQFHTTYTPPQSTEGGSEGDEAKVVEVLSSRESTPALSQSLPPPSSGSHLVDPQGHRIVAIIDLDDLDENEQKFDEERHSGLLTPATSCSNVLSFTEKNENRSVSLKPSKNSSVVSPSVNKTCKSSQVEEEDDEIVFRKVDTEREKSPVSKKKKRKNYDEKELRLVASLSLVSSDSESEYSERKIQKLSTSAVAETSPFVVKKTFDCNVRKLTFLDDESFTEHERDHQEVKCTLCQVSFLQVKRLIHHMRRKHREYNGDVLLEKPRAGQDSCMTIRLRYMQRTTFYECQLCGRIDDVFREHKEHIIEKHPNESKSLKDPIMKQLKCPVCKVKCGAQYLSLCRHIISSHGYREYKSHLRELVHVSAFGWNAARQQEVAKTAKIFQFIKRKTFFFECKICRKVVAGYLNHLRHANEHQTFATNKTKVKRTASKEIIETKTAPIKRLLKTTNLNKLNENVRNNKESLSKKLGKVDLSKNVVNNKKIQNKSKKLEKVINKSKNILKPIKNDVQKPKFKSNQTEKVKKPSKIVKSKNHGSVAENRPKKSMQISSKLSPKNRELQKLPSGEKLTKVKPKRESSKKDSEKTKDKLIRSKVKGTETLKSQVKKIKVKAAIRQIDLQKYKCKYCLKKFKGFRLYNLHLLQQHKEIEYTKCNKCNKFYSDSFNLEQHIKQCSQIFSTLKHKRKFSKRTSSAENSTGSFPPCLTEVPEKCDMSSENYLWLKDLLKLKNSPQISDSNKNCIGSTDTTFFIQKQLNFQCRYCLHFFVNKKDLEEHKNQHHLQNPDIFIKYKPLKTKNINK